MECLVSEPDLERKAQNQARLEEANRITQVLERRRGKINERLINERLFGRTAYFTATGLSCYGKEGRKESSGLRIRDL